MSHTKDDACELCDCSRAKHYTGTPCNLWVCDTCLQIVLDSPGESGTVLHCVRQMEKDSWEYRLKRPTDPPNVDDVILLTDAPEASARNLKGEGKL
jgi:hypothetical protein